ncbi:nickel pincer cofactor biosynthesis protein LarB [Acidiferrimicrobium sp. IK]|uniref:nickel pincer cofactor biosynthesis protein LarB n=1 Tax=Acidiferrimicrobium sp. IK TaxID=2871700 RepID=UPI0021CB394A|nr:nickel pincer cofactor biosynthesis protein LarB [Acidiferrimicrobium sp. IK]MCU4185981.1 nickel pincer cofactor biosynthesis protein LarB [Acidiferrimicrobium sp. IK]
MEVSALHQLVDRIRSGEVGPDDAVRELRRLPFVDLGYAKVDHHRPIRQGRPEAVFAPGKTPAQCAGIVAELLGHAGGGPVVLSRADPTQVTIALAANPGGEVSGDTVVWRAAPPRPEKVLVVTAGTADLPVADECRATLAAFGFNASLLADVGVAGLHRLLAHLDELEQADAVVVVAGMEGALASVIGGLTSVPVVAVPTSVGYGAALEGVTALLGMLCACSSGLTVVGIDNGFGAAFAVARLWPTPAGTAVPAELDEPAPVGTDVPAGVERPGTAQAGQSQ